MAIRIRNGYYLAAGLLAILFAVSHAWNGQSTVLPLLQASGIDLGTRTVFTYVWHIITAENLVFGIVFLLLALHSEHSQNHFAAWIIVWLLAVRLGVIVGLTALQDLSAISDTLIDSIAIVFYVVLILLGIMKKKR